MRGKWERDELRGTGVRGGRREGRLAAVLRLSKGAGAGSARGKGRAGVFMLHDTLSLAHMGDPVIIRVTCLLFVLRPRDTSVEPFWPAAPDEMHTLSSPLGYASSTSRVFIVSFGVQVLQSI